MKTFLFFITLLLSTTAFCDDLLVKKAQSLNASYLEDLAVQHNGRVKPLHTLARESILYITGKYNYQGLDALTLYVALMAYPELAVDSELINVRSPQVRTMLNLDPKKRFYSSKEFSQSGLEDLARPLLEKEQAKSSSLSTEEKDFLEVFHQYQLLESIKSGQHMLQAIDFSYLSSAHGMIQENPVITKAQNLITSFRLNEADKIKSLSEDLKNSVLQQSMPDILKSQIPRVPYEVLYNKSRMFFWASVLYLILSALLLIPFTRKKISNQLILTLVMLPLMLQALGFSLRVYLTGFAPVTNMYGTMLWVSFGVVLFSLILLKLYQQTKLVAGIWIGSGLILLLAENMPLILSPDLDPIVAVLRSNYWLTIHVLTITISYAAFTIAMILGNIAIFRSFLYSSDSAFQKTAAHSAYRMIQLGVFLLSVGIILGGIWADYSWGRFWGWDPKETWALIADLGFLAILHARFLGWLRDFGLLVAATASYLLVIMAWYGVNFILAAGLHSYGFSSGGTQIVATFVSLQVLMISAAIALKYFKSASHSK